MEQQTFSKNGQPLVEAPKTPPNLLIWALETTNDIQDSLIRTVQYVLKEVNQHVPNEKRLLDTYPFRSQCSRLYVVVWVVRTGRMKSVWAAQLSQPASRTVKMLPLENYQHCPYT